LRRWRTPRSTRAHLILLTLPTLFIAVTAHHETRMLFSLSLFIDER
jgi:hypothetical protein